jgi:hypothetical protein
MLSPALLMMIFSSFKKKSQVLFSVDFLLYFFVFFFRMRSVVRDLRELAKRLSALPKSSEKNKNLIEGALYGASAAPTELQSVVNQIAIHVHGVYVLRPPQRVHLRLDKLRLVPFNFFMFH